MYPPQLGSRRFNSQFFLFLFFTGFHKLVVFLKTNENNWELNLRESSWGGVGNVCDILLEVRSSTEKEARMEIGSAGQDCEVVKPLLLNEGTKNHLRSS